MNKTNEDLDIELWKRFLEKTMAINREVYIIDVIIGILMIIIFFVSVLGNLVTCIVIYYDRTMHTATNYYLFNLAVSDLIVTFAIPLEVQYFFTSTYEFGSVECKIHFFFVVLLWNNSILTMTALAVERYVAIWYPLSNFKPVWRRILKIIVIMWIIAVFETLPEIITVDVMTTKRLSTCFTVPTKKARVINGILALVTFIVPLVIMTTVYLMIALKVNRNERTQHKVFNHPRHSSKINKLIVAITVSFLVCWIPFFMTRAMIFALDLRDLIKYETLWRILQNSAIFNSWISMAINPILFSLMSTKFREALKALWIEKIRRHRVSSLRSDTNT